jgi:nucleolar protein 58
MLVLFETPAGFAVFKLLNEKKLKKSENLYEDFETLDGAKKIVKLKMFEKFEDTTEALASATAIVEGKMSKGLKKLLKRVIAEDAHEKLAVADAKLGITIKSKLELDCVHDSAIAELMRCIRSQLSGLITGLQVKSIRCIDIVP